MKRLIIALAALTFIFLYAGCGQSGPLYIADDPSKVSLPTPAPESTTEEDTDEDSGPEKE